MSPRRTGFARVMRQRSRSRPAPTRSSAAARPGASCPARLSVVPLPSLAGVAGSEVPSCRACTRCPSPRCRFTRSTDLGRRPARQSQRSAPNVDLQLSPVAGDPPRLPGFRVDVVRSSPVLARCTARAGAEWGGSFGGGLRFLAGDVVTVLRGLAVPLQRAARSPGPDEATPGRDAAMIQSGLRLRSGCERKPRWHRASGGGGRGCPYGSFR